MTAPSQPTATTICTEALKRFLNGGTPSSAEVTRAENYGMEKVKRDIMGVAREWRPLIRTAYSVTKAGVSHYSNPSDFETDLSIGLMTGAHTGALGVIASSSSVTLEHDEDATQKEVEGKWLLITSGTGADQAEQVDDYDPATKECTMRSAYSTLPVLGDEYVIVNSIADVKYISLSLYDRYQYPGKPGSPVKFTTIEDGSVGQFALYPVPDAIYGIRRRYFADLRKLDTSISLYNTILRRWAGIFEQGVYVWKLGEDDSRWQAEYPIYQQMLTNLCVLDLEGFESNTQQTGAQ